MSCADGSALQWNLDEFEGVAPSDIERRHDEGEWDADLVLSPPSRAYSR